MSHESNDRIQSTEQSTNHHFESSQHTQECFLPANDNAFDSQNNNNNNDHIKHASGSSSQPNTQFETIEIYVEHKSNENQHFPEQHHVVHQHEHSDESSHRESYDQVPPNTHSINENVQTEAECDHSRVDIDSIQNENVQSTNENDQNDKVSVHDETQVGNRNECLTHMCIGSKNKYKQLKGCGCDNNEICDLSIKRRACGILTVKCSLVLHCWNVNCFLFRFIFVSLFCMIELFACRMLTCLFLE